MTYRPLVHLDCDGVLSDFTTPVLRLISDEVEKATGKPVRYSDDDIYDWDIYGSLKVDTHIARRVDDQIKQKGFCARLQPYQDALSGVKALREFADVHVVTSPFDSDYWERERRLWLQEHFGFKSSDVTQTSAKHHVDGDFLVDDKASTVEGWEHGRGILFHRPWNRTSPWPHRANDWAHLVALIKAVV